MRFAIVLFMAVMVVYASANVCSHDCGGHKGGNTVLATSVNNDVTNIVGNKGCDGDKIVATGIANKVTNVVGSTGGHKKGCNTC